MPDLCSRLSCGSFSTRTRTCTARTRKHESTRPPPGTLAHAQSPTLTRTRVCDMVYTIICTIARSCACVRLLTCTYGHGHVWVVRVSVRACASECVRTCVYLWVRVLVRVRVRVLVRACIFNHLSLHGWAQNVISRFGPPTPEPGPDLPCLPTTDPDRPARPRGDPPATPHGRGPGNGARPDTARVVLRSTSESGPAESGPQSCALGRSPSGMLCAADAACTRCAARPGRGRSRPARRLTAPFRRPRTWRSPRRPGAVARRSARSRRLMGPSAERRGAGPAPLLRRAHGGGCWRE